jgi:hypothetical protein
MTTDKELVILVIASKMKRLVDKRKSIPNEDLEMLLDLILGGEA